MDHPNPILTPTKQPQIRVITLGLIKTSTHLLVSSGYDSVKQQAFYRALGGGVEFGEAGRDALRREFQEEIQAELTNIQYLGCIENRFVYEDKSGHELVLLYQCDLADPQFYQQEVISGYEGDQMLTAHWVEIERFKSGELLLVPEECLQYL
ncbi:NUDIX domain-containing protein [Leptolyngbya sp. 7M]|nr:NUDIX domain-containing protein [Leptolyngbya sp. 7M]